MQRDWWRAYVVAALECGSPVLKAFDTCHRNNLWGMHELVVRNCNGAYIAHLNRLYELYKHRAFCPPKFWELALHTAYGMSMFN